MIRTMKHTMAANHVPNFTDPATGRKGRIDFNQPFENVLLDAIDLAARCLYRKRIEEMFRVPPGAAQETWDDLIAETYMYAMRRKETYNPKYTIVAYAGFCLYHTFSYVLERRLRSQCRERRLDDITQEAIEAPISYRNRDYKRAKTNLREEYDDNLLLLKEEGCEPGDLSFTQFVDTAFADGLKLENCSETRKGLHEETVRENFRKEGYEGDFGFMAH